MSALIDSHCHFDFSAFDGQREQTIEQCKAGGIERLIVPGVDLIQCLALIKFKEQYADFIDIAFGLHPYFLDRQCDDAMNQLAALCRQHRDLIIAIGECGIDRNQPELAFQSQLFIEHIKLANELELPLIVHHRQSHDLIQAAFKKIRPKFGGIIHAFSGSEQIARYYCDLGFKLGVGGIISYARSHKTQQTLASIPLASLVLETDAPSMPLSGAQGQDNSPLALYEVLSCLQAIRAEPAEQVCQQVYQSTKDIFRI